LCRFSNAGNFYALCVDFTHNMSAVTFQDVILSAAYDTRQVLRRVAAYAQSPDHPVIPMIPEMEYLKGFAFELVW
jgi:23S rRNA (cytosine1962-C5)-methyltransferase